ncbi:hypothetical protein [Longirhabdus pacifica]|uniref:hypothetical protein n=1 Tax=Longirhabdus pacifica TaxID=2305227 RepID=UPI00100904D6|nr:hypothetical protein [Longirhabdus pacifica]
MLEFIFTFIFALLIVYFISMPLFLVLHELGHAIPLHKASYGKMTIKLGFPIKNGINIGKKCASE